LKYGYNTKKIHSWHLSKNVGDGQMYGRIDVQPNMGKYRDPPSSKLVVDKKLLERFQEN
jgi:hypothetical protein